MKVFFICTHNFENKKEKRITNIEWRFHKSYTHTKEDAYLKWLSNRTLENREKCRQAIRETKRIRKQLTQTRWNIFISRIEHDVHSRQAIAYKIIKHLNKEERDSANISVLNKECGCNITKTSGIPMKTVEMNRTMRLNILAYMQK